MKNKIILIFICITVTILFTCVFLDIKKDEKTENKKEEIKVEEKFLKESEEFKEWIYKKQEIKIKEICLYRKAIDYSRKCRINNVCPLRKKSIKNTFNFYFSFFILYLFHEINFI